MFSALSPVLILLVAFALLPSAADYSMGSPGTTVADCIPSGDHIATDKSDAAKKQCCEDAVEALNDPPPMRPVTMQFNCKTFNAEAYSPGCNVSPTSNNMGYLMIYNNHPAPLATYKAARPICGTVAPTGGVKDDPHMLSLGGGKFDFRGLPNVFFALWAMATFHVNGMTVERTFKKKGGQVVHGSFFSRIAFHLAAASYGAVFAEVRAEQPGSIRFSLDESMALYTNRTHVELPDISLLVTPQNELVVRAHGLEARAKWNKLRMPLNADGEPVPKDDPSRWYLDTSFRPLNTSVPAIAPHGLIGQSFDGSKLTVHGKRDNYGHGRFFKTSAQGEGAIEGTYQDYIVAGPFATTFKFSRFVTGLKEPKAVGVNAGSVEDDAAE